MQAILCRLINAYVIVILVRVVLSWFPLSPGSALAGVYSFIYNITEPVLGPIRRVMPGVGVGGMGLDFSPIIVILLLQVVVARIVC